MKKLLLALLALMLFTAACGADSKTAEGGNESPQRIVSISPSETETLFAIGAGDRVVAVDQYSYYPEESPVTDLDGFTPNVEAIAGYEPDLVIMHPDGDAQAGLESLGITVFSGDAPPTLDDAYARIEQIGAITGNIAEAAAVVLELQTKIDALIADAPDAKGLTYYHELDSILYSVTSHTFIGNVYSLFGLTNVADPADADGTSFGYPQLSDEYIIDANPDLIFIVQPTDEALTAAEAVGARAGWDQLSAVQNGHIIELPPDIASRWSTRLVLFIELIAEAVADLVVAS